jgi:DNA gyrase subunit A
MGVKFVTPKEGDAVAVVARSVEASVVEDAADEAGDDEVDEGVEKGTGETEVSSDLDPGVTIEGSGAGSTEPAATDPDDQGDSEG